jgi:translation initiation factor IF-3
VAGSTGQMGNIGLRPIAKIEGRQMMMVLAPG